MKYFQQLLLITLMLYLPLTVSAEVYQIGDIVDDFTLPDLEGNPVSLSDFEGSVILLNFFATW